MELKPDWAKGYSRVGAAHHGLGNYQEAIQAYQDGSRCSTYRLHVNSTPGLKLDPTNAQLKEGLDVATQEMRGPAGGMFGPDFVTRLAMHPETRPYLSQPDFMGIIAELQANPQAMGKHMHDPRVLKALEVALGLRVATPDEAMADANGHTEEASTAPMEVCLEGCGGVSPTHATMSPTPCTQQAEPTPQPEPTPAAPEPLAPEARADAEARAAAMAAKDKGNAAYKAKDFEAALRHYGEALALFFDVSFLTNRAAVYYEMGDYAQVCFRDWKDCATVVFAHQCALQCLQDCDEAIEKGRELRVDYKLIGRAYTRRGNALVKLGRLEEAVEAYQKALTEHRYAVTMHPVAAVMNLWTACHHYDGCVGRGHHQ